MNYFVAIPEVKFQNFDLSAYGIRKQHLKVISYTFLPFRIITSPVLQMSEHKIKSKTYIVYPEYHSQDDSKGCE